MLAVRNAGRGGAGRRGAARRGGGSGVGDCGAPGGGAESARRASLRAGRAARSAVAEAEACGADRGVGRLPPGPVFGGRWGGDGRLAVYRCHNYAGLELLTGVW